MKAYFISDLHLGAKYDPDPLQRERRVVEFLHSIAADADRLYLVGDILDYWFEYKTVVPRGFVRFFGALASLADAGVKVTWFIGNHDIWLFDYLRNEIGMEVVDGSLVTEIYSRRFYISHGDGLGRLEPGFRFIRSIFRNPVCQKLYSGIHPRWTVPFAHNWSSHSRTGQKADSFDPATDPMVRFAEETLANNPTINYFVFGHRHVLLDRELSPTCRCIILGDWLTHDSYGVFDGSEFRLERFKN